MQGFWFILRLWSCLFGAGALAGWCLWVVTLCGILSDLVLFPGCLCCFVVWILDLLCTFVVRAVLICDFLSILFAKAA